MTSYWFSIKCVALWHSGYDHHRSGASPSRHYKVNQGIRRIKVSAIAEFMKPIPLTICLHLLPFLYIKRISVTPYLEVQWWLTAVPYKN